MDIYNVLNMIGYHQKFLYTRPLMTLYIADTGPLWSQQAKRILWYTYFHRQSLVTFGMLHFLLLLIFNMPSAASFCCMGTPSWSLQDVQLSVG